MNLSESKVTILLDTPKPPQGLSTLSEAYDKITEAGRYKIPNELPPVQPARLPSCDRLVEMLAVRLNFDKHILQKLLEAVADTDNLELVETLRKDLVLAKLSLDTSDTAHAGAIRLAQNIHAQKVKEYNERLDNIKSATQLRTDLVKEAIREYRKQWFKLVDDTVKALSNTVTKTPENAFHFAIAASLQNYNKDLVSKTETGHIFKVKRIKSFGHQVIKVLCDRAQTIYSQYEELEKLKSWNKVPLKELEYEYYNCKCFSDSVTLLNILLERVGVRKPMLDPSTCEFLFDENEEVDVPLAADHYLNFFQHRWFDQKHLSYPYD